MNLFAALSTYVHFDADVSLRQPEVGPGIVKCAGTSCR
jgi:hypothetical protein